MVILMNIVLAIFIASSRVGVDAQESSISPENPAWRTQASNLIYAQQLVFNMKACHPDLRTIGIHTLDEPANMDNINSTIIAIDMERVGKPGAWWDYLIQREGYTFLKTKDTDPNAYEIVMPMEDSTGKPLGTSINWIFKWKRATEDPPALYEKAYKYNKEIAKQITPGKSLTERIEKLEPKGSKS